MKLVHEDELFVVIDDFLQPKELSLVSDFVLGRDYKHINTVDKVSKVWRIRDGFPLRSTDSYMRDYCDGKVKERWEYPVGNQMDKFADALHNTLPAFKRLVGTPLTDWTRFSITSWIYPRGTGLSQHEDAGPYSGSYAYFLNDHWDIHWGGTLVVLPRKASERIDSYKNSVGESNFRAKKWLNGAEESKLISDCAVAKMVIPRKNRLVIMSRAAQHLVTTINENAGDNVRVSIAGFFENFRPEP